MIKLSSENSSVNWVAKGENDGKPSYFKLSIGQLALDATITTEKFIYATDADCRNEPFNQLVLEKLSKEGSCSCQPGVSYGKNLDKIVEHFPVCENGEARGGFYEEVRKISKEIQIKPCTKLQYLGTSHEVPMPSQRDVAMFWYKFINPPIVVVREKYVILDFVAMVGSIGGTLGLCIGFSFYDFIKNLATHLASCILTVTGHKTEMNENKMVNKSRPNDECSIRAMRIHLFDLQKKIDQLTKENPNSGLISVQ